MKDLFYHTDPIAALGEAGVDLEQSAEAAVAEVTGNTGAPAPGTGQPAGTETTAPPAEAKKTETEQTGTGQPPEAIPYPRFKEVNDQLRVYKGIEELGYDADSLRQLAQWGVQFDLNPVDSFIGLGEELGDRLPENVREALKEASGTQPTTSKPEATANDDEPPEWAKPLLEDKQQRDAEKERQARSETLEGLLTKWKELDEEQGISSIPDKHILTYISGNAGVADTLDDLLEKARGEWLELRTSTLEGSVERDDSGAPRRVPGSGAPVNELPPKPKSLVEANELIEAAEKAGTLDLSGVSRRT